MDNRIVPIRTDESAEDFWFRPRASNEVDPTNGRVIPREHRSNMTTPYGRQRNPWHANQAPRPPPLSPTPEPVIRLPALVSSRVVERKVMRGALEEVDLNASRLNRREAQLMHENRLLKEQLSAALAIGKELAELCMKDPA